MAQRIFFTRVELESTPAQRQEWYEEHETLFARGDITARNVMKVSGAYSNSKRRRQTISGGHDSTKEDPDVSLQ